ncbi:MAG: signal transduction histidine kinase, partial [Piptocephalis tieghemiana]
VVDFETFGQLLEMDEEDDHDFSRSIVYNYFEQAEATFTDMNKALAQEDLEALSRLGHFLKGSSAALGLQQVQVTCEKIQHCGNQLDDQGAHEISSSQAMDRLKSLIHLVKEQYTEAEGHLRGFY